jgi:hypothetical protein
LLGEQWSSAAGVSAAGRPRLPVRLMVSLLYLKNSFNLSDEEMVQRWSENPQVRHRSRPAAGDRQSRQPLGVAFGAIL